MTGHPRPLPATFTPADLAEMTETEAKSYPESNMPGPVHEAEMLPATRPDAALPARQNEVPVSVMLDNALRTGASVEVMNGLYDLYKRTQEDKARAALTEALASFRARCPRIARTREGYHKRKDGTPAMYADLSSMCIVADPIMAECGLTYSWTPTSGDGWIEQECIVRHRDGASIAAKSLRFPIGKAADAGEVLRADGYARRNSFINATGLTSADEEDTSAAPDPITADQVTILEGWLSETGDADGWRPRLLKWAGVDSVEKIPATKFDEAVAKAKAKKGQRAT